MSRRTALAASAAVVLVALGLLGLLALLGASDQLLGFAYTMLLCVVAVSTSQLIMRSGSKRH